MNRQPVHGIQTVHCGVFILLRVCVPGRIFGIRWKGERWMMSLGVKNRLNGAEEVRHERASEVPRVRK